MTVTKKLALADLLRTWRSLFGGEWVTGQQAIRNLCHPAYYRDNFHQFGIKSGGDDELSNHLDKIRNKLIYNFVVKRDVPYMQPAKWRVLLQDNRVKISNEERKDFRTVRKEAGLKIDPATAEVDWSWEQTLDPYGICPDLSEKYQQTGREYFARAPGSDIWVLFDDLPDETEAALWDLLERRSHERQREQASPVDDESPRSAA